MIALGCFDIAVMVYCIMNELSYSSNFNIFAVIAGVLLVRGSLRTARVVGWFLAFFLSAFGTLLIVFPLLQPLDLSLMQLRADFSEAALSLAVSLGILVLLMWIYWQLRSPSVLSALRASGQTATAPKSAFVLGIGLVAALAVTMQLVIRSESGIKAIQLAQEQVGPGYRFHVTDMRWSGNQVNAQIAAYNEREIKKVNVQWQQ